MVGLSRYRAAPVIGWFGIGMLVFFLLVYMALIEMHTGSIWRKLIAELLMGVVFLGPVYFLSQTCILPGRIFRRIGLTDPYRL